MELEVLNPQDIMIKGVKYALMLTSAILIWLEIKPCFEIGNQRPKELSCADWHSPRAGSEATFTA